MGDKQVKVAKRAKEWKAENQDVPASERHIPWPEIFKHHISAVEGHTRMLEMIQKHTVKGHDNWDTITAMVIRSREMLRQAKDSSKSFVPPPNQQEKVPIGSSYESMYPGYSPGEIECVEASEVDNYIGSERTGSQSLANGTEHKVGQGQSAKLRLPQKDKENLGTGELGKNMTEVKSTGKSEDGEKVPQGSKNGYKRDPSFVVDTDSTPLAIPLQKDEGREKGKKKSKTGREKGKGEEKVKDIVVETKGISAGAEVRPKVKEAKARSKESKEKKRRRGESEDEDPDRVVKKPKKDKGKKREADRGSCGRESEDKDPDKVVKKLKKDKGKKREAEDCGSGGRDRKRQRKDAE